jgi:hypothetical protein
MNEKKKRAKLMPIIGILEDSNISLDFLSKWLISSPMISLHFLVKPNHKSFQMVSDMMDFRLYSTSSNEVFATIKPNNPPVLALNS